MTRGSSSSSHSKRGLASASKATRQRVASMGGRASHKDKGILSGILGNR